MLLAEQNVGLWPLVGVVVAMLLLLMTFWRISRRATSRGEADWPKRGQSDSVSSGGLGTTGYPGRSGLNGRLPVADAPPNLVAWEVHMQETARELSAWVDTKLRLLQHLVAEADRAATRLERALATAQTVNQTPPFCQAEKEQIFPPEQAWRSLSEPSERGLPKTEACPETADSRQENIPSEPTLASSPASGGSAMASQIRPETLPLEVGLLADYGFPPEEIASRCGISVSEVERLLQERNRHGRKGSN
ncbi:MAG: hypothetical protein NZ602_12950 [Thermoguttaceae bacterium]|nr:hypothetical protein [Thermoguttaceae bacterium]MDW8036622.1 hypothetical protein [Thermoguttaceae bacterium]